MRLLGVRRTMLWVCTLVCAATGAHDAEPGEDERRIGRVVFDRHSEPAELTLLEKMWHPERHYPNLRYEPDFHIRLPDMEDTGWAGFVGPESTRGQADYARPIELLYILQEETVTSPAEYVLVGVTVEHNPAASAFDHLQTTYAVEVPNDDNFIYWLDLSWVRAGAEWRFASFSYTAAPALQQPSPHWQWQRHIHAAAARSAVDSFYELLEVDSGYGKWCANVELYLREDLTVTASGTQCEYVSRSSGVQ